MNREIKFRAWVHTYSGKEMIYDWCYLNKEDNHFYATDTTNERPDIGEVYNVMQFIGLLDKNGKEIYEGDILKNTLHDTWTEISFKKGCYYGNFVAHDNIVGGYDIDNIGKLDMRFFEVIGNIYENKELLNQ